jgi:hypothetical protein
MSISDLNWDNISKTIGTVAQTAEQISGAVNSINQAKINATTYRNPSTGSDSTLLGLLVLGAIFLLKK